jgi:hypothetical protein
MHTLTQKLINSNLSSGANLQMDVVDVLAAHRVDKHHKHELQQICEASQYMPLNLQQQIEK